MCWWESNSPEDFVCRSLKARGLGKDMTPEQAKGLIERVEREAEELDRFGYRFPALYSAVIQLLEIAPNHKLKQTTSMGQNG